jgi:hypothetical protein
MTLKELFNSYKQSLAQADELEKLYEAEPDNTELETAFDSAYNNNFSDYLTLAQALVNVTNGQIDLNTAKQMIKTQLDRLEKIIEIA